MNDIIEPLNEYQAKAMVFINIGLEGYLELFKFLTDYEFKEIKAHLPEFLGNGNKKRNFIKSINYATCL